MHDTPNAIDELNDLLDKPVNDWRPEQAGDRVVGTVIELTEAEGTYGVFPVVTIDGGTELVRVAASRSVLEREIRSRDIRPGDALAVEYQGEKVSAAGTKYFGYRLIHKAASREGPRVPTVHDNEPPDDGYDDEPPPDYPDDSF